MYSWNNINIQARFKPLEAEIKKWSAEEKTEPVVSDTPEEDLSVDLDEQSKQQAIYHNDDIHGLRLTFAPKLYWLLMVWLIGVLIIIILSGFGGVGSFKFHLSDTVLIAFMSTTVVHVIGTFLVFAKWLYPKNQPTNN